MISVNKEMETMWTILYGTCNNPGSVRLKPEQSILNRFYL